MCGQSVDENASSVVKNPCYAEEEVPSQRQGVLIIGHGTRDAEGVSEFFELVKQVQLRQAPKRVEAAFLELANPTIDDGINALVAAGVEQIAVMPLLLFAAGHAKRDIPAAIRVAATRHRNVRFALADHLGCQPSMVDLSRLRFDAALQGQPDLDLSDTVLLMIGRGSHDPEANAEMYQFSRLRWEARATGRLEIGFTAITEPTIEQAVNACRSFGYQNVVVQPHLLFRGQLIDRVRDSVEIARSECSAKSWQLTEHLGPHPLLVDALTDRLATAVPVDR